MLKPIWGREPLIACKRLPMIPGQMSVNSERLENLYKCLSESMTGTAAYEPAYTLACLLRDDPDAERVAERIEDALTLQAEDGSFDMPVNDAVALVRASWVKYVRKPGNDRARAILRWLAWAAEHESAVAADPAVKAAPADLLELIENVYTVTGRKWLVKFGGKLCADTMDWTGRLNTFDQRRSFVPSCEASEEAKTFALHNVAEALADGARACLAKSRITGSAVSASAFKNGWERIARSHAAACGGVTGAPFVAGGSPVSDVSTAVLGAWAEAFALRGALSEEAWADDAQERIMLNGMAAALNGKTVKAVQHVNAYQTDSAPADEHTLIRAARAVCAWYAGMCMNEIGSAVSVVHLGTYDCALRLNGEPAMLSVSGETDQAEVFVRVKQPLKAEVRIRIPAWAESASIMLNGRKGSGEHRPGSWAVISRTWNNGDKIGITFERKLTTENGYHQSVCVYYGPELMAACPKDGRLAAAAGTAVLKEGKVILPVAALKVNKKDIPVLPAVTGSLEDTEMAPYASLAERISQFPTAGGTEA